MIKSISMNPKSSPSQHRPGIGEFERHVAEAIQSNLARRSYYRRQAGWVAWLLSISLVFSERLTIPIARRVDRQALPFQEKGIPILANDFVEMSEIPPKESLPVYHGQADRKLRREVKRLLRKAKKASLAALSRRNYRIVQEELSAALRKLERIQETEKVHFAMTRHLLESAGIAALHVPSYIRASSGEAEELCRRFVKMQVRLIDQAIFVDTLAQKCHAKGVGILVNDVPDIPFLEELGSPAS